jgi:hypothetical protein
MELRGLDQDIQDFFMSNLKGEYIPKLPVLIQIERHLRALKESIDSQNRTNNSKNAKNNIEP